MKTTRLLFMSVFLFAVTAAGESRAAAGKLSAENSAAEGFSSGADRAGFFKPDLREALFGKWVNTAYRGNNPDHAQKVILYHWGYCETFNKADEKTPSSKATFTLVDKWTDAGGNVWYREFRREMGARPSRIIFCLDKVSGDGALMESVYDFGDFPVEADMDPRNPRYRVLYRR